ncbi:MAG: stage II sporulation protein M [Frankia sp.]
MDLDAYTSVHRPEWDRLAVLVRRAGRPRRLRDGELDELVDLYQRAATHLSVIRTRWPEPTVVDGLAAGVTRARAVVTGSRDPGWRDVGRFLTVTFPAAVYVRRYWVVATALLCIALGAATGLWIVHSPHAQDALLPRADVRNLCDSDFRNYYSSQPASSFAAQVWTNNVWVAAAAIAGGVLLGLPTLAALVFNALNVGVSGGYLSSCGRSGEFWTLILPHGMLELSTVFVAGAVGLRLGWSVIDPGPRRRTEALAAEGRSAIVVSLGLIVALAVSGAIEAFVTPSGLPAAVRIGIGALAWLAFVLWIAILGRRAVADGATGDLEPALGADLAPVA